MPADGPGSTSFVVIRTDWSVLTALRALDATDATHVDPRRTATSAASIGTSSVPTTSSARCERYPTDATSASALSLPNGRRRRSSPRVTAIGDRAQAIVLDGGRPVGFIDLDAPADGAGPGAGERAARRCRPSRRSRRAARRAGAARRWAQRETTRHGWDGEPVAANGGPDAEAGETERSLEAEFPESVVVDTVEWLLVSIVNAAPTATGLAIDVAAGESIDVLVQPRRGFSVEGDARGTLEVPASGESLPLQFKLKALDEGKGLIRVLAFHLGEPLGVITLEPTVKAAPTSRARGRTTSAPAARKGQALTAPSPQVPDLSLFIEEHEAGGALEFVIRLTAVGPGTRPEPASVRAVPSRGRTRRVLRDVLPGDRRAAAGDQGTARGRRAKAGGQGCVPDRVVDARGPARGAVAGSRSDHLGRHPVRGALDPVGAVPPHGPRRRPGDRGSVPVRGLRGHPLAAR